MSRPSVFNIPTGFKNKEFARREIILQIGLNVSERTITISIILQILLYGDVKHLSTSVNCMPILNNLFMHT